MREKAKNPFEEGKLLLKKPAADLCNIELALVISASHSMKPFWNAFSQEADSFTELLQERIRQKLRDRLGQLRIRVIAYRDLFMDTDAMQLSPFFELPGDAEKLKRFIRSVEPVGGGAEKKSGMEALFCAMYSPWRRNEGRSRHIIVMVTDSAAYIPEEPLRRIDREYMSLLDAQLPAQHLPMPETMDEMRMLWRDGVGTMDNWSHQLMIFTSASDPWLYMSNWDEAQTVKLTKNQIDRLGATGLVNAVIGQM